VSEIFPFFAIAIVVAFVIVGGYYAHVQAKKRREELEGLARQLGWHFDAAKQGDWDNRYTQFDCFTRGHSRYAYNLMEGTTSVAGRSVNGVMGDYTYKVTSGSGKNRRTTTYNFSFILLAMPLPGVPHLAVRPEHIFDKIGSFMGFDDIDFESEEFSRKFHVKSADKRFAYDVICPTMMEFMLDEPPPPFEINEEVLLVANSKRWKGEEFTRNLEWTARFFANWPRHVVADLTSRVTG
jgi:hypothetical protein